jgi:hypothetical protein
LKWIIQQIEGTVGNHLPFYDLDHDKFSGELLLLFVLFVLFVLVVFMVQKMTKKNDIYIYFISYGDINLQLLKHFVARNGEEEIVTMEKETYTLVDLSLIIPYINISIRTSSSLSFYYSSLSVYVFF